MFGILNTSHIYGIHQSHESSGTNAKTFFSSNSSYATKENNKFTTALNNTFSLKPSANFIEKFFKIELPNSYETIKNYKNFQLTSPASSNSVYNSQDDGVLTNFNCLQGSYSHKGGDCEFYESVNVRSGKFIQKFSTVKEKHSSLEDMTIKCSKNLLAEPPEPQSPATLQNYQKLTECEQEQRTDITIIIPNSSSGSSSGEFNSDGTSRNLSATNNLYKKLSFGGKRIKNTDTAHIQKNENTSGSTSSLTNSTTKTKLLAVPTTTDLKRTSSASSSGDCTTSDTARKQKTYLLNNMDLPIPNSSRSQSNTIKSIAPERAQRRKLMQVISNYEQQNKALQRELVKEKRRRSEELALVVKSLICFESKLKCDMKTVNQRLQEKDTEICRLVRQNRTLWKKLHSVQKKKSESARDEGVVEDSELEGDRYSDKDLLDNEDCLEIEALKCINCRKQFYDIELREACTQTALKDGNRKIDAHTTEQGSSSDDTVSSSFFGARRSVRYTSKRTTGTFRDYMQSRSMNIDDPSLDNNSEENTSTVSMDDSQTSYEKIHIYSRTIERMHGVKCDSDGESEREKLLLRSPILGNKNQRSGGNANKSNKIVSEIEEDDGIFSPTQDDEDVVNFDENLNRTECQLKILRHRSMEFSEASPKQVYETSTDDWYASASDQEEIGPNAAKLYGRGAVNPVLECVNQILLQQSMEDSIQDKFTSMMGHSISASESLLLQTTPKTSMNNLQATGSLPRRSSLSGFRNTNCNSHSSDGTLTRKRVHFSTKNSMVHVPRNDEQDDNDYNTNHEFNIVNEETNTLHEDYHPMHYYPSQTTQLGNQVTSNLTTTKVLIEATEQDRLETLNYESIYSNEYEPIGSEHNSSNLYMDMEPTIKKPIQMSANSLISKTTKSPPALPPKPANLLKFKKCLQQLNESPDEHLPTDSASSRTTISEPDYCSISEVNINARNVQIVVDVHKAPESETEMEPLQDNMDTASDSEMNLEVSTVVSDNTCAASQKTDEIEEIFADIPKLPNVAAIIAPKVPKNQQQLCKLQNDYLIMSPKVSTSNAKTKPILNNSANNFFKTHTTPSKIYKLDMNATPSKLPSHLTCYQSPYQLNYQQHKRKQLPNILAEINKRISLTPPNNSSSTTIPANFSSLSPKPKTNNANVFSKEVLDDNSTNLPLQAEFDWYNLDAEYGRAATNPPDLVKVTDNLNVTLEEISEDHECNMSAADEYNLDEEFSLASESLDGGLKETDHPNFTEQITEVNPTNSNSTCDQLNTAICEAINFPLFSENSPQAFTSPNKKETKIKNNLANFEKFIEGSGLSTKALPNKRKIYFAGPFV